MEKKSYQNMAKAVLTRMADPDQGANMIGLSSVLYQKALQDTNSVSSEIAKNLLTQAMLNDHELLELKKSAIAKQNFEFANLVKIFEISPQRLARGGGNAGDAKQDRIR